MFKNKIINFLYATYLNESEDKNLNIFINSNINHTNNIIKTYLSFDINGVKYKMTISKLILFKKFINSVSSGENNTTMFIIEDGNITFKVNLDTRSIVIEDNKKSRFMDFKFKYEEFEEFMSVIFYSSDYIPTISSNIYLSKIFSDFEEMISTLNHKINDTLNNIINLNNTDNFIQSCNNIDEDEINTVQNQVENKIFSMVEEETDEDVETKKQEYDKIYQKAIKDVIGYHSLDDLYNSLINTCNKDFDKFIMDLGLRYTYLNKDDLKVTYEYYHKLIENCELCDDIKKQPLIIGTGKIHFITREIGTLFFTFVDLKENTTVDPRVDIIYKVILSTIFGYMFRLDENKVKDDLEKLHKDYLTVSNKPFDYYWNEYMNYKNKLSILIKYSESLESIQNILNNVLNKYAIQCPKQKKENIESDDNKNVNEISNEYNINDDNMVKDDNVNIEISDDVLNYLTSHFNDNLRNKFLTMIDMRINQKKEIEEIYSILSEDEFRKFNLNNMVYLLIIDNKKYLTNLDYVKEKLKEADMSYSELVTQYYDFIKK